MKKRNDINSIEAYISFRWMSRCQWNLKEIVIYRVAENAENVEQRAKQAEIVL